MKIVRRALMLPVAVCCVLLGAGTAGASGAAGGHFGDVTCTGGLIHSGTYHSIKVTGICKVGKKATVVVQQDLVVEDGAGLNAITLGTLTVHGNLIVENNGILGLGCSPAAGCKGTSDDSVGGFLYADHPLAVIAHSNTIGGNVTVLGGGGGLDCGSTQLFGGPPFTTFEDNTIGGSVMWQHMVTCWAGFFRNHVAGSVAFNGNQTGDPDGNEVQTNIIAGNLACYNNSPAPQRGDSGGQPNQVGGKKLGQCKAV
jgi:hypothetical protein